MLHLFRQQAGAARHAGLSPWLVQTHRAYNMQAKQTHQSLRKVCWPHNNVQLRRQQQHRGS